jgi:hypothetical protein
MVEIAPDTIPPSFAQDIEDAILLGNVTELDSILTRIGDDEDFPKELRAGLEALRHFRAHYGKNGVRPPQNETEKKKTTLMETAWSAELLEMIRQKHPKAAKQA